jgi:hypothetical protein
LASADVAVTVTTSAARSGARAFNVFVTPAWFMTMNTAAAAATAMSAAPADAIRFRRVRDAWSNAAALGSRDAQYHFAAQPLFNPVNPAIEVDYLRDWYARAPGYMTAAADAGDARAVLSLALAYDSQRDEFSISTDDDGTSPALWSTVLGQAQSADSAIAYRYYLLDRLLGDQSQLPWRDAALTRLAAQMTPQQVAAAERWAQTIAARSR